MKHLFQTLHWCFVSCSMFVSSWCFQYKEPFNYDAWYPSLTKGEKNVNIQGKTQCHKAQRPMQEMNRPQTQTVITITVFINTKAKHSQLSNSWTQGFQNGGSLRRKAAKHRRSWISERQGNWASERGRLKHLTTHSNFGEGRRPSERQNDHLCFFSNFR